ncbi:MAG TPA: cytochrome P450 [Hyphomicrobiaceae bacterium]|nr:cytochrome P450 [Hyphomicrobiaceae bacterium]
MGETEDEAPLYPPAAPAASRELPLWRAIPALIRNPLRFVPDTIYRQPLAFYRRLGIDYALVADPALVMSVLLGDAAKYEKSALEQDVLGPTMGNGPLTASGDLWRWQRKVSAPLFRHGDVLAHVPRMAASAENQIRLWRETKLAAGQAHDIQPAMKDATFDVITSTILAGCTPEEAAVIKRAEEIASKYIQWDILFRLLHLPAALWYPYKHTLKSAAMDMRAALHVLIWRRKLAGGPPGDILARLESAVDPATGAPMSDELVCDNLATFLEAGHETTALALTWTIYLLARSPVWQDRLREEAFAVAGQGPIEPGHVERLPLTMRVLKESMRLYPPVPTIVRVVREETILGGRKLAKGTLVFVLVYATHRHHSLWEDPDRFDPDRFTPDRERAMKRGQFMPFGAGHRTCIGMGFALVSAATMLASFLRAARFEWDGRHLPEPLNLVNLHPKGGMPVRLTLL